MFTMPDHSTGAIPRLSAPHHANNPAMAGERRAVRPARAQRIRASERRLHYI